MKTAIIIAALALAGCGAGGNVYEQPLPGNNDTEALMNVRDKVKPEDAGAWQTIAMSIVNPMAKRIQSKTVGEAIARFKARSACMNKHGTSNVDSNDVDAYNEEVRAYNACLKMPL